MIHLPNDRTSVAAAHRTSRCRVGIAGQPDGAEPPGCLLPATNQPAKRALAAACGSTPRMNSAGSRDQNCSSPTTVSFRSR